MIKTLIRTVLTGAVPSRRESFGLPDEYSQRQTYDALIAMGVPPQVAAAMAVNPTLMQQLLPQYVGKNQPQK
jgi:hypothetical protein